MAKHFSKSTERSDELSTTCNPKVIKGTVAHGVSSFPKYLEFASLCSFICLQAVYQLSGPEY